MPWPAAPHGPGLISFALLDDLEEYFGLGSLLRVVEQRQTSDFIKGGWPQLGIRLSDAYNIFGDLIRQTLEKSFRLRRLKSYMLSDYEAVWWPHTTLRLRAKFLFGGTPLLVRARFRAYRTSEVYTGTTASLFLCEVDPYSTFPSLGDSYFRKTDKNH